MRQTTEGRMPLYTVNGIVLKYADYKDYDRMITYFTKEMGKLSVLFRGCRRRARPSTRMGSKA